MKVFDLQCGQQHVFEGWFASEEDYLSQHARGLVECPLCGDANITKRLSAPRLNLGGSRDPAPATQEEVASNNLQPALQSAMMAVARRILENTTDVGDNFAEEARKIHYGETQERGIRGQTSLAEAEALMEEGIVVMPFSVPESLKGPLQ